ncbi:MAG TPA: hypothetical protein VNW15_10550 [Rhizomicrobium sp.]|nr:hypothetical protein [Rhizomicrobium sp.]
MKNAAGLLLLLALALAPAAAQPAPKNDPALETVIVTAPRLHAGVTPNAIAHDFVKSFAAPTVLRDAIARWQVAICPQFIGVAPNFAEVMETRLRTIAGQAGAPMKEKGCKPNLTVAVTPQPQAYLDALHAKNVEALGYHGATTVTHPVQAWYVTGTQDVRGTEFLDKDAFFVLNIFGGGGIDPMSTAPLTNTGGWRDHPDLSSDLLYVTIIVDSSKTGTLMVGEIADYVAMLALSRTEDYDDCQLMPSIANLLSSRCDDKLKPSEITPTDIAYLRGVYKMDAGATLQIQQDQIAGEMASALAGGK